MRKLLIILLTVLGFTGASFATDRIDINTAKKKELKTLNGVGSAKAKAIINYRTEKGKFKTVDELDNVRGFTKKGIDELREQVTVGSEGLK